MNFDITKQTTKKESFRVEKLIGMFDIQNAHLEQHFKGEIILPDKWNVGAIVGRSGTGKSTIARHLWGIYETQFTDKPIIDEMPQDHTVEDITKMFTNVGFSSPPHWLRPFNVLSNGEKMRVELAKSLLENNNPTVFDEFTSVVDRDVAKVVSMVVAKTARKTDKQFIAVSCHRDILEWLEPDWVFDCDIMKQIDVKKNATLSKLGSVEDNTQTGSCLRTITI